MWSNILDFILFCIFAYVAFQFFEIPWKINRVEELLKKSNETLDRILETIERL